MTEKEKKKQAGLIAAAVLLLWVLWLPLVSSGNIRFDSDRMFYNPRIAMEQYRSEGRFALVWLLQLMGLDTWHPLRSGILFMLFFTITGLVLCHGLYFFSDRIKKTGLVLFFLLHGTCPILAYHVYFTLQIAPVGLGMLLASCAAWVDVYLAVRQPSSAWLRILWHIFSIGLLMMITSIYQALIVYYVSAVMIFLFCDSQSNHRSHRWPALWLRAGKVTLAVALYWYFSGLGQTGKYSYLRNQILWDKAPLTQCLENIGIEYGKMMIPLHSACMSLFPVAVCLLIIWMVRTKNPGPVRRQSLLYAVILLLLPAAMSILEGNRTVPRTQFSLPLIAAFLAVFCGGVFRKGRKILIMLCCAAIGLQICMVARLTFTDNERNHTDLEAAKKIIADLGDTEDKPLVFVGSMPFAEDSVLMEKRDVYGCSYFEWNYGEDRPGSATPAAMRLLQAVKGEEMNGMTDYSLMMQATEEAEDQPAYPEEGYVRETEQMVIVKLSD